MEETSSPQIANAGKATKCNEHATKQGQAFADKELRHLRAGADCQRLISATTGLGGKRTLASEGYACGEKLRDRGIVTPIWRGWRKEPQVSWTVQAYSDEPVLAPHRRRQAAGNPRGYASATRQVIHANFQTRFQRAGKTNATTLRIHQERVAAFGKLAHWIEAGNTHRNLRTDSCTVPPLRLYVHAS